MKSSQTTTKTILFLLFSSVLLGYWAYSQAAGERPAREYEIVVPPIKSDMVRMVEAYERLSDQYLMLVQHHLQGMDAGQRQILQKLETLEKKLDELSKKLDPPAPPKPAEPKP